MHIESYLNGGNIEQVPETLKIFERSFIKKSRKTLLDYLRDYIKLRQSNSVRNTWKEYRTLYGRLEKYQKARETVLYFESITQDFANDLKLWAKEVDLNPNTLKEKTIVPLGTFLSHFYDDQRKLGFYIPDDYKTEKFKKVTGTHNPPPSPLYPEEVEALENFKPKDIFYQDADGDKIKITEDTVKRLFLLGCYTGPRFGDINRLTKGNFKKDTIIIRASKTDKNLLPIFISPYSKIQRTF